VGCSYAYYARTAGVQITGSCRAMRNRVVRLREDMMPHIESHDGMKHHCEKAGRGGPIVFVHQFLGDCK
jgi:hypothetical protein